MTSVTVRPLQDADREAWLSLRQALWMGSDATTRAAADGTLLREPQKFGALAYAVLLAIEAGRAVGFAEVSLRDDIDGLKERRTGYVEGVYVGPRQQKRGVGRALLEAAADWTRTQGVDQLSADVQPDNPASLAFHERSGFQRIGYTGSGTTKQILLLRRV